MPITSLKFRPGINKETTSYSNKGGWNDCDKVRFRFGYPEKLGGWEKYSSNTFEGTARSLHTWANLLGDNYLGIGTEKKFYIEEAETYRDITPIRRKVVSGEVVFDIGGQTVQFAVSGVAGTTGQGTATATFTLNVLARNPDTGVLSIGTGQIGTVTVTTVQRPITANLHATGAIGNVTVEDTRNESVSVG